MSDREIPTPWTYRKDADMWKSPNGQVAIEGPVIRQMAELLLRQRLGNPALATEDEYGCAVADVLGGEWRLRLRTVVC
jgi:hypothetical protein